MTELLTEHHATAVTRRLQDGLQFRVNSGEIIVVYRSGAIAFQGKSTALAYRLSETLKNKAQ